MLCHVERILSRIIGSLYIINYLCTIRGRIFSSGINIPLSPLNSELLEELNPLIGVGGSHAYS